MLNSIISKFIIPVILLTACGSSFANDSITKVNFNYNSMKGMDFENDFINSIFEDFIINIQKKDNLYNKTIKNYNTQYLKNLEKQLKKAIYRDDEKQDIAIYQVNYDEKNRFNEIKKMFYFDELSYFNDFINKIKTTDQITEKERKVLLMASKPLIKTYSNFTGNYKFLSNSIDETCFKYPKKLKNNNLYDYTNNYCSHIYSTFNEGFSINLRNFTKYGINDLISIYMGNIHKGDFLRNLNDRINEIIRLKNEKNGN